MPQGGSACSIFLRCGRRGQSPILGVVVSRTALPARCPLSTAGKIHDNCFVRALPHCKVCVERKPEMDVSRRIVTRVLGAVLLVSGLAGPARARVMILDNPIRQPFSGFASSMAVVGDLDGDGVSDYLIGAYDQRVENGDHQGRAFVFSGQSGKLLMTIENPAPSHMESYKGAAFGFAVAAAGDVNGDGTPDLLIG